MRTTDIIFGIVALVVVLSLWKLHRDPTTTFNIFDLVMENGRLSRLAVAFWSTFAVLSWIMVRLAVDGKMSEGYLTSYGAIFVAPVIAKMFSSPALPGTTTTTTATQKVTEVT